MSATNVQFSVALHLMAALGYAEGKELSSGILADSVNADPSFVRKSLSKLVKSGLVRANRGKHGAYTLMRPPEQISLQEIYAASGAPAAFSVHTYPVEPECPISSNIKPCTCEILSEVQKGVEQTLCNRTLADLLSSICARAQ